MIKRVRPTNHPTAFSPSPVLKGESAEAFEGLHDALNEELKPRGILEALLVADMAEKAWEIRRYRRVKTNLINSARRPGVKKLLESVVEYSSEQVYSRWQNEIYRLTEQWFSDESDKNEVLEIFERFGLDESAVEAAAMRIAAPDLEKLDRLSLAGSAAEQGTAFARRFAWRVCRTAASRQGRPCHRRQDSCAGRCFEEAPSGGIIRGHRSTNCRQSSQRASQHRTTFGRG